VKFDEDEMESIMSNAQKATMYGGSQIRSASSRQATCGDDQIAGQLGELALHKFFYGKDGFKYYQQSRDKRNANPKKGDGGRDLFDGEKHLDADVKCTRLQYGAKAIRYNMVVPEKEFYKDWVYIAAFCGKTDESTDKNDAVILAGWIYASDIEELRDFKTYGKRHYCGVNELRPMSELTIETISKE
jgi:hypothetical protein